jgi:hypothetical protein
MACGPSKEEISKLAPAEMDLVAHDTLWRQRKAALGGAVNEFRSSPECDAPQG